MSENTLPETPRELREQADQLIKEARARMKAAPREPIPAVSNALTAEAYGLENEAKSLYDQADLIERQATR